VAAIDLGTGTALGDNGRYRLERLLGTGGMASVWLATDARLEREVAIKVLSDVLALDQDYVARFEREARLAARLSHPHLVAIYDFSAQRTRPYLVLEYVAGGTLADRLRSPQAPNWDPVMLAEELLGALAYIHGAGIIHRDIKPANVLIGADGRARLTDFGIAQPSEATRMTRTGHVVGTQRYLAPELVAGEPATARSDLYSFGILLGECLRPGSPAKLRRLVGALTAADPQQRPKSADSALVDLRAPDAAPTATLRMPARVSARPDSLTGPRPQRPVVTRSGRAVQIHVSRTTAAMAAAGLVLIVGLVLLISGGSPSSTPPAQTPASAPLSQQLDGLDQTISQARR
jgi:serine/threonine protein kinase